MCSISCFPNTCGVGGRKDKWFLLIIQLYECLLSCSVVSNSLQAPWTVACQAPLSMRFSRQQYWSGLPFPSPGLIIYIYMYIQLTFIEYSVHTILQQPSEVEVTFLYR